MSRTKKVNEETEDMKSKEITEQTEGVKCEEITEQTEGEKPKKTTPKKNPVERAEENLRKAEGRSKKAADAEKKARRELEQAKRNERTHHLCVRGGAVNMMLRDGNAFTDEEVTELVKLAFSAPEIQQRIDERVPPVTEEKANENTEEKPE